MPIKLQDSTALVTWNVSKEKLYLEVVKDGEGKHLQAVSKNWFGRLLMWLGWSSASIKVVAGYINDLAQEYLEPRQLPGLKNLDIYEALDLLGSKFDFHAISHMPFGYMKASARVTYEADKRIKEIKNAFASVTTE